MVWLTWRQHRAEALGGLLALAAVAASLLALGLPAHHAFAHEGIAACLAQASSGPVLTSGSCGEALKLFSGRYLNSGAGGLIPWLNFLPAAIGVFVGAPLLAREFEHGTWRLAWTQAVPRTRWLAVKLVLLVAGVAALTAVTAVLFTWYRGPFDQIDGRMWASAFDFEGLTIPAYALFAFALGILAGILTRRIVVSMAVTLGGFLAVRLPVEFWLRPHYQRPVTMTVDPLSTQGPTRVDQVLSTNLIDSAGHTLSDLQTRRVMDAALQGATRGDVNTYLQAHSYHWSYVFQPAARFWHFQLIEAAIFIGLAAALLTSAVWLLRRRVG
ncbi:MAG TPA: ABC transporter permease subunit [Actinomycetota bacterium]